MSWKLLIAAVAAMAVPACAFADDDTGGMQWPHPPGGWLHPYVALDLGYHWPSPINARSIQNAPDGQPYEWQYKLNGDWNAFMRAGYRLSPHFRIEFDGGLRESNIHSIHSTSPEGANGLASGRPGEPYGLCDLTNVPPPCAQINRPHVNWAYADNGMINLVYDIEPERRLTPFVGVGAGIYHLQFDAHFYYSGVPGPISSSNPAVQTLQLGGSIDRPTQFAYQAIGGISYKLRRKLALDVTYRFIDAPFLRWNTVNDTPNIPHLTGLRPGDFRGGSSDASVSVGLRYQL